MAVNPVKKDFTIDDIDEIFNNIDEPEDYYLGINTVAGRPNDQTIYSARYEAWYGEEPDGATMMRARMAHLTAQVEYAKCQQESFISVDRMKNAKPSSLTLSESSDSLSSAATVREELNQAGAKKANKVWENRFRSPCCSIM